MKHTITVLAQANVEVDLGKFPVDALMDEIKSRNDATARRRLETAMAQHREKIEEADSYEDEWVRIPRLSSGDQHPLHGIYYALKFGKEAHALDLLRDYLGDQLGVVL